MVCLNGEMNAPAGLPHEFSPGRAGAQLQAPAQLWAAMGLRCSRIAISARSRLGGAVPQTHPAFSARADLAGAIGSLAFALRTGSVGFDFPGEAKQVLPIVTSFFSLALWP